jgi:pyruvate dehydrogenase E2 component (dihydrolipoamide acetyltransferase)
LRRKHPSNGHKEKNMIKEIKIPEISDNVSSGKIVAVLVKPGDTVAVDDTLVEIETDKAVVELPSPYAGKISEVLVQQGDEKRIGDVVAKIEVQETEGAKETEEKEAEAQQKEQDRERRELEEEKQELEEEEKHEKQAAEQETKSREIPEKEPVPDEEKAGPPPPAAPSVRRIARELGVDIRAVRGSGPEGRISQADVHAYVKQRLSEGAPRQRQEEADARLPDFSRWGAIRTEKLETVRRLTAESTALSWRLAPQVTQFDEADITDLQAFIQTHAKRAEEHDGKLTITAVLTKVCAVALARFARFNASLDMQMGELIYKNYIHIGVAVDTPRGLLVPVIRDVPDKDLFQLAAEIVDVARRARSKKIKPEELEGGTFTISNQGGIGGTAFTPVILWPQAAILGVSRARRVLIERHGDFEPRTVLPLCVTYDHRIVDGADAARFLDWICRSLENAMTMFT